MGGIENVFVHHVYFWLKNKDSQEDLDKLVAGLRRLSGQNHPPVPYRRCSRYQLGEVIERSYSVSWLVFVRQ